MFESSSAYPPRGAARAEIGILLSVGESPTHNLHVSLSASFEQKLLLERAGKQVDATLVVVDPFGPHGAARLKRVLAGEESDWTHDLGKVAFNGSSVSYTMRCAAKGSRVGTCSDNLPDPIPAPVCIDTLFAAAPLSHLGGFPLHASTSAALVRGDRVFQHFDRRLCCYVGRASRARQAPLRRRRCTADATGGLALRARGRDAAHHDERHVPKPGAAGGTSIASSPPPRPPRVLR